MTQIGTERAHCGVACGELNGGPPSTINPVCVIFMALIGKPCTGGILEVFESGPWVGGRRPLNTWGTIVNVASRGPSQLNGANTGAPDRHEMEERIKIISVPDLDGEKICISTLDGSTCRGCSLI